MEFETTSHQAVEGPPPIPLPFPKAVMGRVAYGIYIIAVPALAFWANNILGPEWQSGELSDYIKLFLFPEASLIFFLLLAYSILCYLFLLSAPTREAQLSFIRFGIYTGTFLALQYSILSVPVLWNTGFRAVFLVVWIFPLVFWALYRWMIARWTTSTVNNVLFMIVVIGLVVGIWLGETFVFVMMLLTMAAPFWSFLIAIRATIWLLKNYETKFNLARGLGLVAWFAAYALAWRYDILKMAELYAALPKQPPPDCYIATAAARGHPRFVRARKVQRVDGTSMRVNTQLQRLKCAELALMAINPRLHQSLRRIYDVVGNYLARRIQNPFLADVAYLLLKPCEWFARLLLKGIVPEIDSISKKMYM